MYSLSRQLTRFLYRELTIPLYYLPSNQQFLTVQHNGSFDVR
jgi:hypothetical protein